MKWSNEVYNKITNICQHNKYLLEYIGLFTCFDLLTGHHQAISGVSQRCCLDTGIPIFTVLNNIKSGIE
jgi:hypothetical protein